MPRFIIRYWREGLLTDGRWSSTLDAGFVTCADATRTEVGWEVDKIKSTCDGITGRLSRLSIQEVTEAEAIEAMRGQWLWGAISKATMSACERMGCALKLKPRT